MQMAKRKIGSFLMLLLLPCLSFAFPLDPVRIHIKGDLADESGNPITTPEPITFTVWQGGSPNELGSGTLLFEEEAAVQASPRGKFSHWLGEGNVVKGTLEGAGYELDKQLFVQTRCRNTERRCQLGATDREYVGNARAVYGELKSLGALRTFEPDFDAPAPRTLRRPQVRLYPDGWIQRENGALIDVRGSKTAGLQEFFDYCAEHNVDGYIVGGSEPDGQQIGYFCDEPVRIHPAQGFRLDTGSIGIIFSSNVIKKNGLTIDSCMMVDINIRGLILYRGQGAALAIAPGNALPLDTFVGATMVDTQIHATTILGPETCVLFDGSINFCRFSFNEINGGKTGIHVAPKCSLSNSEVVCKHVHGQSETCVLAESGGNNVWQVNCYADAQEPYGIVTNGVLDIWLASARTRSKPGLVIGERAQGNQFHFTDMGAGFENRAERPTNRIYVTPSLAAAVTKLGFSVETPPVPESGAPCMNRNPYPVVVRIKKTEAITGWSIVDAYGASDHVGAPMAVGQSVTLMPAEALVLEYTGDAPEWKWRAVQ